MREWAIPGIKGLEHRVGGLEKEELSGNVSYEPDNHEKMVKLRQAKIDNIASFIPEIKCDLEKGDVLVLGWGSTYGAIKVAVNQLKKEGVSVAQVHLRHLNPLPKNLGEVISRFKTVLIPELNNGQLIHIIRDKFLVDAKGLNKIKGQPLYAEEIKAAVKELM